MRIRTGFLAGFLTLALAGSASAQFSATMGSTMSGTGGTSGNTSSFFSGVMTKPNFSAIQTKPTVPPPLNLASFLPTFPNLQNTMLMRNMFGGTQAVMQMPTRQAPPPLKKKSWLFNY